MGSLRQAGLVCGTIEGGQELVRPAWPMGQTRLIGPKWHRCHTLFIRQSTRQEWLLRTAIGPTWRLTGPIWYWCHCNRWDQQGDRSCCVQWIVINVIVEANRVVVAVGIVVTVDKEGGVADVVLRVRLEWLDVVYSESRLVRY